MFHSLIYESIFFASQLTLAVFRDFIRLSHLNVHCGTLGAAGDIQF